MKHLSISGVIPQILIALAALFAPQTTANAQNEVGIKTNLLYDATATVNLGAEMGLAPKWTLDISANYNGWTLSHDRRWKHWVIQPEARYWFCDRFAGHFVGAHIHGGQYNIGGIDGIYHLFGTDARKLRDTRYQGWFAGAGIAYGYAWILNRNWNFETEIGFGYSYTKYDRFRCAGCGKKIETDKSHHYVGPTKAAVNLVYLF